MVRQQVHRPSPGKLKDLLLPVESDNISDGKQHLSSLIIYPPKYRCRLFAPFGQFFQLINNFLHKCPPSRITFHGNGLFQCANRGLGFEFFQRHGSVLTLPRMAARKLPDEVFDGVLYPFGQGFYSTALYGECILLRRHPSQAGMWNATVLANVRKESTAGYDQLVTIPAFYRNTSWKRVDCSQDLVLFLHQEQRQVNHLQHLSSFANGKYRQVVTTW